MSLSTDCSAIHTFSRVPFHGWSREKRSIDSERKWDSNVELMTKGCISCFGECLPSVRLIFDDEASIISDFLENVLTAWRTNSKTH